MFGPSLRARNLALMLWICIAQCVCAQSTHSDYLASDDLPSASAVSAADDHQPTATDQNEQNAAPKSKSDAKTVQDLLNLDLEQLSKLNVGKTRSQQTNLSAPSSQLSGASAENGQVSTTADLLKQAPSVSARRVSAISLDPRVRGYHSSQLNATANGVNQLKARVDIDTLFSQIDPGIVQDITIIDGPYTSLYGPGFAFMIADLLRAPRFDSPQTHASSSFVYGSNAQTLYTRENVVSGGKDWGVCFSYGLRDGNDYYSGGPNGFLVPSRYQKWDGMLAVGYDLDSISHIDFNCLRTEMNGVQLPGVVYDIQNSKNDQYNLTYSIQEDRNGPKQVVVQAWYTQTAYFGDSSQSSKHKSFYNGYMYESSLQDNVSLANTNGLGYLDTIGARFLRTFGDVDAPQWTLGADWRRYRQRYFETTWTTNGQLAWDTLYGVPKSQMDDIGALTDVMLPLTESFSINVGGRVDRAIASLDTSDPIVSQDDYHTYTPRFAENANTLGMAYITAKQKLSEKSTLKAGVAFAMRNPDLTELYNYESYVPLYRFGNTYVDGLSTLEPEKNIQFDLGLSHKDEKSSYGVRGFTAIIYDYIMAVPTYVTPGPPSSIQASKVLGRNFQYWDPYERTDYYPNQNADYCQAGYAYVNVKQVSLLGGDLFGERVVSDGFSVFGNMSYVYGVNNTPVTTIPHAPWYSTTNEIVRIKGTDGLPGIYPLCGNIGFRFFEPEEDRWCIEFSCRMVRAQDHVARTVSEIAAPGYTTFDLRGYYRIRKNIRLSVDIKNILNRYYIEPGSLAIIAPNGVATFTPEPGITVLTAIEARF